MRSRVLQSANIGFCSLALSAALFACGSSDDPGVVPATGGATFGGGGAAATGNTPGAGGVAASGGATGAGGIVGAGGIGASSGAGGGVASGGAGGATGGAPGLDGDSGTPNDGGTTLPPFEGTGDPWVKPAPRATCRTEDKGESGIQGLGTDVRCNMDILGQVPATHFLSLAWYKRCAYVNDTTGTHVIDVTDPAKPTVLKQLTTTGMQSNWETMKVHEGRGLLAGYQSNGPVLDVYDVAQDCKNPVLKKSFNVGGSGHSGQFSNDGTIYYASSLFSAQVFAVDVKDPANPSIITSNFERSTHDLNVGKSGTRGYFVFSQLLNFTSGSLAIMDLSQVQARASGAKGTLIKEVTWADGAASQYPIPITYRGRDYLVMTDELGSGSCADPNKPQYGYARIFDIHDEKNPTLVSKIKTEAQDPAHCTAATAQAGTFFGVGTHYCNVDRQDNPRLLSCGLWAGGVRLYDIRNPWRPKEVAYFNVPNTQVPGLTRILPTERELWVSTSSTFYVLRLPDAVVGPILAD